MEDLTPKTVYVDLVPTGPVAVPHPSQEGQVVVAPGLGLQCACPSCGKVMVTNNGAIVLAILQHRYKGTGSCSQCGQRVIPQVPLIAKPTGGVPHVIK